MRFLNTKWGRACTVALTALTVILCGLLLLRPDLLLWIFPELGRTFAERVSLCGLLLTVVVAMAAVPQLLSLADTVRSSHYSQLDGIYFALLKMAVDKPYLRSQVPRSAGEAAEYDAYAFGVWNFIETLRDRCEADQALKDIWAPVIATEHALHGAWFYDQTVPYWEKEAPKFRLPFADFIWTRFGRVDPVCGNVLHGKKAQWIWQSWKLRDVATIRKDLNVKRCVGEPERHGASAAAEQPGPPPEAPGGSAA